MRGRQRFVFVAVLGGALTKLHRTGFPGDWVRWVPRSLVSFVLMFLLATVSSNAAQVRPSRGVGRKQCEVARSRA